MKILDAAIKKRLHKSQQDTMTTETKAELEHLFQKATTENKASTATKALAQAHAKLHKQSPPPISP